MKLKALMPQLGMGFGTFCFITAAQAGIPLWSFTPDNNFPPKAVVVSTGTVLVKYTITNNSSKTHNLVIKPQTGVSQNGPCLLGPKGSVNSTCLLQLTITGSSLPASGLLGGPVLCQANSDRTPNPNTCYQPSKAEDSLAITVVRGTPILSASTMNLALSVNDTGTNAALTGNPRQIIITNTGDAPTTGLSISYPTWPSGTTVNTTSPSACVNGTILAAGASCTITVVPGATASSGAGNAACTTGIAPTPGVVSVTANNANQTATNVVVLGYGCQYQGGLVYSVDDSYLDYPESGSIGGKVATLVDQAPPYILTGPQVGSIIWSSDGNPGAVDFATILGIDETSTTSVPSPTSPAYPPGTPAYTACDGSSDGACDASNIVSYYNFNRTNGGVAPTPLNYYAAGLCEDSINDYTGWYLPAICEMDAAFTGSVVCPVGMQSMAADLSFLLGDYTAATPSTSCAPPSGIDCLAGYYWSSTEYATDPLNSAWYEVFNIGGSTQNPGSPKSTPLGVRCSRALTL